MNQKFIAAFCNVQKEICRDVAIIYRKRFAATLQGGNGVIHENNYLDVFRINGWIYYVIHVQESQKI